MNCRVLLRSFKQEKTTPKDLYTLISQAMTGLLSSCCQNEVEGPAPPMCIREG